MSRTSYRWVWVGLAGASLMLGACAGDRGPAESGATVPPGEDTTTTTPTAVPGIPAVIDEPYLNGVLESLNRVYGDITRKRLATGRVEPEDLVPLRAIYNEPEFTIQADVLVKTPALPPEEVRQPPGDRRMTVKRIVAAKKDCVALVVDYDFSALRTNPPPVKDWYVVLRPTNVNADPDNLNPTPWSFAAESSTEVNPCNG